MFGLLSDNPIYLIKDNRGIATNLAACFKKVGIKVTVTDVPPNDAFSVIYLRRLDDLEGDILFKQLQIHETAFSAAKICGDNLLKNPNKTGLFVTVQDTGGDFGIQSDVVKGSFGSGLSGLAKTASLEWENASVKAIDIECGSRSVEAIAEAIFNEILQGGSETEVGLKENGERISVVTEIAPETGKHFPLQNGDVILVSGGARGITSACLSQLTLTTKLKIAIFGRTKLIEEKDYLKASYTDAELKHVISEKYLKEGKSITPLQLSNEVKRILASREIKRNLRIIAENGSEVEYFSVDITDYDELKKAVTKIRQKWGKINGIIHAAGVLADKLIHEKSLEQFKQVFNTKVTGFYNLLNATKYDELTHVCCFSSVSARYGNKGQVDYAMANEVLNKVSKELFMQKSKKCLVKSINWGPWDGGMVTPTLKAHFRAEGIALLSLSDGAKHFVEEFTHHDDAVEVVIGSPIVSTKFNGITKTWAVRFHRDTHTFIASHMIKGNPVVPAVYITEICLTLARKTFPKNLPLKCENFKVLKGMVLKDFDGNGDWFYVNSKKLSNDLISFVITSVSGIKHYSLDIVVSPPKAVGRTTIPVENRQLPEWEWRTSDIYEDKLFHGDEFRVIKELVGISEHGCKAILHKKKPLKGATPADELNSAIIDGGLQLALLWRLFLRDEKSLPTGYKELEFFAPIPYAQDITCYIEVLGNNEYSSKFNISFYDLTGKIIAKISAVDMHILLA